MVFENAVFRVFADDVSDEAGREVKRYLNVTPKSSTTELVTGVGVLPVRDGRVGLIRTFRHPLDRWSWEVPKGFLDAGETPRDAAVRELREETGYACAADGLADLGLVAPEPGMVAGRIRLYAVYLKDTNSPSDREAELGHGELAFFARHDVASLIESGEIEDGCTLSILFKLAIEEPEYLSWPRSPDLT